MPFTVWEKSSFLYTYELSFEVCLAGGLRETLNGVAEGGARHSTEAGLQEGLQGLRVPLPGFPEQPAHGLLNEVVRVMQEDIGNGKGIVQLAVTDKGHSADNANALLPDGLSVTGKVIEKGAVLVKEPFAKERVAGQVHKVPVVYAVRVGKVEVNAAALQRGVLLRVSEDLDQRQQRGEPQLVILAGNALFQFLEAGALPASFHYAARHRHLDTQELVTVAVLSGPGLEKP